VIKKKIFLVFDEVKIKNEEGCLSGLKKF